MLRNVDDMPLGDARAGDLGAPSTAGPREVRERPPSKLRNVEGGPLGGAQVGGSGAPTINAKKRRR
jgi:hypothetical protein